MKREKDDRRFWMNVLTSAVVAVIVFFVLSWIAPSIGLSPKPTGATPYPSGEINANACSADGVCESNVLQTRGINVEGDQNAYLSVSLDENQDSQADTSLSVTNELVNLATNGKFLTFFKSRNWTASPIYSMAYGVGSGNIQRLIQEVYVTDDNSVSNKFYTDIVFHKLNGTGNSYACLDANGRLFRKTVPCDS